MGRPTTCTPEVTQRIAALIREGIFEETAAQACGVSKATFYEWQARGNGTDKSRPSAPEYEAFAEACAEARALAEIDKVREVRAAGKPAEVDPETGKPKHGGGDWKATAWLLERRFDRYRLTTKTEISGPNGGAVETIAKVVMMPAPDASDEVTGPIDDGDDDDPGGPLVAQPGPTGGR